MSRVSPSPALAGEGRGEGGRTFALGLDYGTESARAVLVRVETGEVVASAVHPYRNGVIDERIPVKGGRTLGTDWALQNPDDYLSALTATIPAVLKKSHVSPDRVIGIGVDFTSCTILPARSDGTPLCAIPKFRNRPHAWVKLWKHHSAQPEAARINKIARERGEPFLARYGGAISSEWFFPKVLEILNDDPAVYAAADKIIEAQDWLVWQLTGRECRSACGAGYKAMWSKSAGFPSTDFFRALHPKMKNIVAEKINADFHAPGRRAGRLTSEWASRTGLNPGTPVGVAIIDAHAAVLGCGVARPNEMVMCMGTSTCHLLLSSRGKNVRGVCGVVEDGILPGFFAYEAGQAAVGDSFAWFVRQLSGQNSKSGEIPRLYTRLEASAAALRPGESGLVALDWWNGSRSVLMNADLSGLLVGCTLDTSPPEIYRALMESTAMGTLKIIQTFEQSNVRVRKLIAAGGLAERSSLLMQIYADVTGREISVVQGLQICAIGAAILGASSAGERGGENIQSIIDRMACRSVKSYNPKMNHHRIYSRLYAEYIRLHDYFGRENLSLMKHLKSEKVKV